MKIDERVTPSFFSVLSHKYTDASDDDLKAFLTNCAIEMCDYMHLNFGDLLCTHRVEDMTADDCVKIMFAAYGVKWRKVWAALAASFPLTENYDRTEEYYTATENGKETVTETPTGGSIISNYQTGYAQTESTYETAPYDDGLKDTTKTTTKTTPHDDYKTYTKTEQAEGTHTTTETEHVAVTKTALSDTVTGDVIEVHKSHIHGNIGVTTAPAMITEALTLYAMHNFVPVICSDIADLFSVGVWG